MECSNCGNPNAKLHTRMVDGAEKRVCLCQACYDKLYAAAGAPEMFAQLFGGKRPSAKKNLVCASCGTTLDAFLRSGLLGCAGCYLAFRDDIAVSLKYCQRNNLHRGKKPNGISELKYDLVREQEAFRAQLDAAVLSGDRALAQELFRRLKELQARINRAEAAAEEIRTEEARWTVTEEDD